jgi:undecaprenyl-phosphate alpha-N-acetylglucosaminyl 1-phosphatetransferase/UDP-N-acetylglucosamine 2-epimerase
MVSALSHKRPITTEPRELMDHPHLVTASMIALAVTLFTIFSLRPTARRFGLVDKPDSRKRHRGYIPLIGGLCFFVGTIAGMVYLGYPDRFVSALLAGAALIVAIGVLDDLVGLNVRSRLVAEAAAIGLVIAASGYHIDDLGQLFGESTRLGLLGVPLTIVAVIGLINAYNMLDGIDGLAAAVTMVSIAAILLFAGTGTAGPPILLLLCVLFAALIPYLFVNLGWPDGRKIFMGDAGSMLLGFLLAWSLIYLSHENVGRIAPVHVLWCVALPVMDTFAVMYRRFRKGLSPFKPDRQHLHHLLLDAGFSPRGVLLMIVVASSFLAAFGYALRNAPDIVNVGAFFALMAAYVFWLPQLRLEPPGRARRRPVPAPDATGPSAPAGPTPQPQPWRPAVVGQSAPAARALQPHQPLRALCVLPASQETGSIAPFAQRMSRDARFQSTVCIAAAPGQTMDDALRPFDIRPDMRIEMEAATGPESVSASALDGMQRILDEVDPDVVLVPGDADTALATILAAYHQHIPVVCVDTRVSAAGDAGARDPARRIVHTLATLHVASPSAQRGLVAQGVPEERIVVSGGAGDTAVDTLHAALEKLPREQQETNAARYPFLRAGRPMVLVTEGAENIDCAAAVAQALREVAGTRPDVDVVRILDPARAAAERTDAWRDAPPNIHAIEAPDDLARAQLMRDARLIVGCKRPGPAATRTPIVIVRNDSADGRDPARTNVRRVLPADPGELVRQMLSLLERDQGHAGGSRARGNGPFHVPARQASAPYSREEP